MKTIRDFIYVDVPKLYSLYSQVFEGAGDRYISERINQLLTGDSQTLKTETSGSQALTSSRQTETGFLHDHMYNRLEESLRNDITNASDIDTSEIEAVLTQSVMVKVVGSAEIEDYKAIQEYIDNFNHIAEIIAYAGKASDQEFKAKVAQLSQNIAQGHNRKQFQEELDRLQNSILLAYQAGLAQDGKMLAGIKDMIELFKPDGYDVVIATQSNSTVRYRGVLNREWLRINPQLLVSLYGGTSPLEWTLVGTVTHITSENAPLAPNELPEIDPGNPQLLDHFRGMFRSSRVFERMFLESNTALEIVVSPLAIYREYSLGE